MKDALALQSVRRGVFMRAAKACERSMPELLVVHGGVSHTSTQVYHVHH